MKARLIPFLLVLVLPMSASLARELPPNATDPTELVSLAESTPMDLALEVLSEVSRRSIGKIVVDPEGRTTPIGIAVHQQHYRDALELILRVNRLEFRETPEYILVVGAGLGAGAGEAEGPKVGLQTREVRIKAVFFEVERGYLQEIGVDWSIIKDGEVGVGLTSRGGSGVADPFGSATVLGDFASGRYTISLDMLLNLIEAEDHGTVIARPQIVVMDTQKGRIQVGQDFSIKTQDFAGNTMDSFYSAGTILEVTPSVYREGDIDFIQLRLMVERSTANPSTVSTVVNKAQASSQVLLRDGEHTIIGGLYTSEVRHVDRGFPILRHIPRWFFGLGYLFGTDRRDISTRELIIVIQAELLTPLAARSLDQQDTGLIEAERRANEAWRIRTMSGPGVVVLPTRDES